MALPAGLFPRILLLISLPAYDCQPSKPIKTNYHKARTIHRPTPRCGRVHHRPPEPEVPRIGCRREFFEDNPGGENSLTGVAGRRHRHSVKLQSLENGRRKKVINADQVIPPDYFSTSTSTPATITITVSERYYHEFGEINYRQA